MHSGSRYTNDIDRWGATINKTFLATPLLMNKIQYKRNEAHFPPHTSLNANLELKVQIFSKWNKKMFLNFIGQKIAGQAFLRIRFYRLLDRAIFRAQNVFLSGNDSPNFRIRIVIGLVWTDPRLEIDQWAESWATLI